MRMFLIGMCDIFLILYLTSAANVKPATVLTVDDFYTLKSMHETLKADKEKSEETFEGKLRQEREEKERLRREQQKQEELAAARLKEFAGQKENLEAKLAREKERLQDMEKSLSLSDAERERIAQDLKEKEEIVKVGEQQLADLNEEIVAKEEARRKMEASYQQEVNSQQEAIEENRRLAEQLQVEVRDAQFLANQMQEEAALAYKTAETAITVQEKALLLKEEALKEKEAAQRKAAEALAARREAEAQRERALEDMNSAKADRKRAERNVRMLAATVKEIKQDGETAFEENIRPLLQMLNVTYERKIADGVTRYQRELRLLPVKINGQIYVVFPSRQIGFTVRLDRAPDGLVIMYQGQKISHGRINTDDDLMAIALPGYENDADALYPADTEINEFMPTLLALRNSGNVSLVEKIRGISDDYFIVNRDHLKIDKDNRLKYDVKGFRGTGMRGERILRGDQLIDLNGRLIGVARDTDSVIRFNSLSGWSNIDF